MRFFTPPDHAGPDYFAGVCESIRDVGPGEFMVSPGDLDPPDRVRATIDQVLGEEYVWYPVVGNHEGDLPQYIVYMREYNPGGKALPGIVRCGPPGAVETCYAFDHQNVHFVVINQYYDGQRDIIGDGDVGDALYAWLEQDLAGNDKPFTFVFGHEPTVSIPDMCNGQVRHRGGSLDKYAEHNHRFWTLLREYRVTAYCCGHTHRASVSRINGVWQLDCGHARGKGDPGAKSSFLMIYVQPDGIRADVYRRDELDGAYKLTYSEKLR